MSSLAKKSRPDSGVKDHRGAKHILRAGRLSGDFTIFRARTGEPVNPPAAGNGLLEMNLTGDGGGAEGNRTPDLLIANEALSQLSYSPIAGNAAPGT